MDIEIQNKKNEALFKNGKYQYTFIPKAPKEKIKLYNMGCVGDTRLNHIQLEHGNEATFYMAPERKVNSLSGIFKQLRDLDIQMRDQNSELWGKIKLNNTGAILDFYKENIKTEITTLAGKVNLAISELDNKVLKKTDVSITSNGITIGSGKTIDGRTIASIMKVQPDSIDLISPLIRVTGNMVLDGTLEGRKIKANTLETGHHKAGSITTEILAANAVKSNNLYVDNAMIIKFLANSAFITELFAKKAFINQLQTVKITSTQIDTNLLAAYNGKIGSFSIGDNAHANYGKWITGVNQFQIGMSDGTNGEQGTALWVNWGNKWNVEGPQSWYVMNNGAMIVNNRANINALYVTGDSYFSRRLRAQGDGVDVGASDVFGTVGGANSTVIWWGQIDRVKSAISDKRLKENIQPTKVNALDTLNQIEMVEFNWKKDGKFEKIGAIAQQVEKIDESLVVQHFEDKDTPTDYLRINYYDTIPYLIKAIQELSKENKKIKKEIEEIKYAR